MKLSRLCALLPLLSLLLAGCLSPLSRTAVDRVDRDTTFAMVADNPSAYLDRHLLLGGVVLAVEEEGEGSVLEVMEWRLTPWGEPLSLHEAGRRFLVRSRQQLDSGHYQPGRLVTLTGVVLGSETRLRGEHPHDYPLFALEEIHLWRGPFRYGIHPHPDPQFPYYVGPEDGSRSHPYDPGYSAYPYTPYWYRVH
ncbi:MAG: Slp family lipoprotein [Desulfuromonadales bacterium]|nr:Slp family lipoprotein [Desulfuromonadales bacterium]